MPKLKVIIVNDDLLLLQTMQRVLTKAGYEVLVYQAVNDPHARIRAEQPHLVILDLQHGPAGAEWEQLNALHADPATMAIAVLIASSDVRFLRAVADELHLRSCTVMEMPFTSAELIAQVSACIGVSSEA